jgi:hypothetical protein
VPQSATYVVTEASGKGVGRLGIRVRSRPYPQLVVPASRVDPAHLVVNNSGSPFTSHHGPIAELPRDRQPSTLWAWVLEGYLRE